MEEVVDPMTSVLAYSRAASGPSHRLSIDHAVTISAYGDISSDKELEDAHGLADVPEQGARLAKFDGGVHRVAWCLHEASRGVVNLADRERFV
jgi:hypothetical protein